MEQATLSLNPSQKQPKLLEQVRNAIRLKHFEFGWQWVFPAPNISTDPKTGIRRRHHQGTWTLQRAVKQAIRKAGITKRANCQPVGCE